MNARRRPRTPRVPQLSDEERALLEAHLRANPPRGDKAPAARSAPRAKSLTTLARRGDVPVDRTLDLHGRTLAESLRAVEDLLQQSATHGWRYLRVVTGKGNNSAEGRAVLADEIPQRLRVDRRVAEVVRAVRAADGGAGAWFVRLRG